MNERIIYDPGEPVPFRRYPSEGLAALDQAALEAAEIPAFIRQTRFTEVDVGWVVLVVRRGDVAAALEVLSEDASDNSPRNGRSP
jgi:hypothetical protein